MNDPQPRNAPDPALGKPFLLPETLRAKYKDNTGHSHAIKVQNLSRGGICIQDTTYLPIGTSLRFLLKIRGKTIQAQGEVVWSNKEGSSFLHGIKFTFLEQKAQEWFNTFVMDWAAEQVAETLDFSGLELLPAANETERRLFARFKTPLRVEFGFNQETMLIRTQVHDLSEGGLCLSCNFQLKKDQNVYLKLWLYDAHFLPLTGTIKYCVKKTEDTRNVYLNGLEFTKTQQAVAEEITQFLNQKRSQLAAIEITLDDILAQTDHPELP